MSRSTVTLALSSFVVGTCELVIVGLLDRVAGSMAVSISTAGQLVTAYALGIAVGGPVVAAVTSGWAGVSCWCRHSPRSPRATS